MKTPTPRFAVSTATLHFADRLLAACDRVGSPICVGIDPVLDRLPASLRQLDPVQAIEQYVVGLLEAVRDHVPCVKLQAACFERYHWQGLKLYHDLIHKAAAMGLVVIGDAKRGDIGISAEHYAAGCLMDAQTIQGPDALTINSYFGDDGMQPFIKAAGQQHKGLFALVRTSNPGGDAIQNLPLASGGTVAQAVARLVAQQGADHVGQSGYSLLGAVVGATKPQDAQQLRQLMPQQIFLVPGFGAQGGSAEDVKACFNPDGRGALITASRSVIYAYEKQSGDWQHAIEQAAIELGQQVNTARRA